MPAPSAALVDSDPPSRLRGLSWPALVALLTLVGVMAVLPAAGMLADPDTYWHLAVGRWILEHRLVPLSDPFSHSMPGAPWTAHEWLSEVFMALAHRAAGWAGLVAVTALAFALTLARLTRFLLSRMEPIHALLLVAFTAALLMTHLLARPHVWVWPLMALWVAALIDASEEGRAPAWWLLGVIVLWANMHASFFLGLGLALAIGVDAVVSRPKDDRLPCARRWGLFVGLAVAASLLTPQGWHGLAYPLQVMGMGVTLVLIGEWASPDFHRPQPLELWLLLLFGLAMLGRLRLPWVRVVLVLGLLHLALKHQRNVAVLGLVSTFVIARPWAQHWYATAPPAADAQQLDRWFRRLAARPSGLVTAAFCLGMAGLVAIFATLRSFEPRAAMTPAQALAALPAGTLKQPVFNSYRFGGYLIHQGIPVFVDGRADMYGDGLMQQYADAVYVRDRASVVGLLDRYQIGWTLLEPGQPIVTYLDAQPGWRRVHADRTAVIHVREPGPAPRVP